ncbi:MAG: hypothetical protein KBD57_09295 [Bacteroidia bacterium]|nr:hypothetical protein [Bacteroidia bacterium]
MRIYKCDGARFSDGKQCENTTPYEDEKGYPERWLTIKGDITNNDTNRHLIHSYGKMLHFCSWECLYLKL